MAASYFPRTSAEKQVYESLWVSANPNGTAEIGGNQAVEFFRKSRYISMAQSEIPVTPQELISYTDMILPEPRFMGVGLAPLATTESSTPRSAAFTPNLTPTTTEGKDVEVKRIIWVEMDGQDNRTHRHHHSSHTSVSATKSEQSFAISLQKRLLEEKVALQEGELLQLRQMKSINSEMQGLEGQLSLYKQQLDAAKDSHNQVQDELAKRENEKKLLQQQVYETQIQLQSIQLSREESLRKAEENILNEQAANEVNALEDRLLKLKSHLDNARLQQKETESLLQRRFHEREKLKQQVSEIRLSLSASKGEEDIAYVPTVIPASNPTTPSNELEKQAILQQIAEARRVLVRSDSVSKEAGHDISILKGILADLNEDIKLKQSQALPAVTVEDDRSALLRRIAEARKQLTTNTESFVQVSSVYESSIDLSFRQGGASELELSRLHSILQGLEIERDSIAQAQESLARQYEEAKRQLAKEIALLAAASSGDDPVEKEQLIELILNLTTRNQRDSSTIRENVTKFNDLELERVKINELLAKCEADAKAAGRDLSLLLAELEQLRDDATKLDEERIVMKAERERSQSRIDSLKTEIANGRQQLEGQQTAQQTTLQQLAQLQQEKQALLDQIDSVNFELSELKENMGNLAMETKEFELNRKQNEEKLIALSAAHSQSNDQSELRGEIEALKLELMRLNQDKVAMMAELNKMRDKLNANKLAALNSASTADQLQKEVESGAAVVADLLRTKDELQKSVEEAKSALDAVQAQSEEVDKDIEAINKQHTEVANNISDISNELNSMKGESTALTADIAQLRVLKTQLNTARDEKANKVAEQNRLIAEKAQEANNDSAELDRLVNDLSLKREILQAFQSENKSLIASVDSARSELAALEAQLAEQEKILAATEEDAQRVGVTNDQTAAEIDALKKSIDELTSLNKALEMEAKQLSAKQSEALAHNDNLKKYVEMTREAIGTNGGEAANLDSQKASLSDMLQSVTESNFVIQANNNEVKKELSALEEIATALSDEYSQLTAELDRLQAQQNDNSSELALLNDKLAEREAELNNLRGEEQQLLEAKNAINDNINGLRELIGQYTDDIQSKSAELDKLIDSKADTENHLRTASESCFVVNANNNEMTAEMAALQEIIDSLGAEVASYQPEIAQLDDKLRQVSDQLAADSDLLKEKNRELDQLRAIEGGLLNDKAAIKERIEQARQDVKGVANTMLEQANKVGEVEDEHSRVQHELNSKEAEICIAESGNRELEVELDNMKSTLTALLEERNTIEAEMQRLNDKHEESNLSTSELKDKVAEKQADLKAVEDRGRALEDEKQSLNAKIADMRAAVAEAAKEAMHASDGLNSADDIKAAIDHKLNKLQEDIFEADQANKELEHELVADQHVLDALQKELKSIQDELGRIGSEQQSSNELVQEGQNAVREKEKELAAVKEIGENLRKEKELLEATIADLRETVASVAQEAMNASDGLNNVSDIAAGINHKINALEEEAFVQSQQNAELESERKAQQEIVDALAAELKQLEDELGRIGLDNNNVHQSILQKREELEEKQTIADNLRGCTEELRDALDQSKREAEAIKGQISDVADQLLHSRARGDDLSAEKDSLEALCQELDAQIAAETEAVAALQFELESAKMEVDSTVAEREAAEKELAACKEAATALEEQRGAARKAADEKASEIERQKELIDAIKKEKEDLEKELTENQEALEQLGLSKEMLSDGLLNLELERLRSLVETAQKANDDAIKAKLDLEEAAALNRAYKPKSQDKPPRRPVFINPLYASGSDHHPMLPLMVPVSSSMAEAERAPSPKAHSEEVMNFEPLDPISSSESYNPVDQPNTSVFSPSEGIVSDENARKKDDETLAKAEALIARRLRSRPSLLADPTSPPARDSLLKPSSGAHVDVYPVPSVANTTTPTIGSSPSPAPQKRRQSSRRSEAGAGFDLITRLLVAGEER